MSDQQTEFADFFQASWEPCLRAVVAFAKAWMSWRKVSRHPAPRAWVVRTALNAGASWWRHRHRELPLADHELTAPGDHNDGLDATLLTAIWHLPLRQREVIALRIFLDLDTAAIARQLGIEAGTVRMHLTTLTINPKELLDPAALQSDLAQYGIPAKVTSGSLCSSDPAPAGFSQVLSFSPAGPASVTPQPAGQPTITIDPAAMPAGDELSFGYFQLSSGEQQADVVLISNSSYTCSSSPPDPNGLPDGYGPADGVGLLYGGPGPGGS